MIVKGFSFPGDIHIFIMTPFRIARYRRRVNKLGFNNILMNMAKPACYNDADSGFELSLKKHFRVISFYLNKFFNDPNPCVIRSLILYDTCKRNKVKSVLATGVAKNGNMLKGHCWIELNGIPFCENKVGTDIYTKVKEV